MPSSPVRPADAVWVSSPALLEECHGERRINHVGSFCHTDWVQAEVDRLSIMMREAVYDTTSPVGIRDAIRTEAFYPLKGGT